MSDDTSFNLISDDTNSDVPTVKTFSLKPIKNESGEWQVCYKDDDGAWQVVPESESKNPQATLPEANSTSKIKFKLNDPDNNHYVVVFGPGKYGTTTGGLGANDPSLKISKFGYWTRDSSGYSSRDFWYQSAPASSSADDSSDPKGDDDNLSYDCQFTVGLVKKSDGSMEIIDPVFKISVPRQPTSG